MLVTWRCTVCSLTTSRSAICRFVNPSASRPRTSRSRASELRERGQTAWAPRRLEESPRAFRLRARPELDQRLQGGCHFSLGRVGTAQREQGRGELDPRQRGFERPAAPFEAIHGILEQRPRAVVITAGGQEHPLGQVGMGPHRRGADEPLDLP